MSIYCNSLKIYKKISALVVTPLAPDMQKKILSFSNPNIWPRKRAKNAPKKNHKKIHARTRSSKQKPFHALVAFLFKVIRTENSFRNLIKSC